jgi:hypothetical protein
MKSAILARTMLFLLFLAGCGGTDYSPTAPPVTPAPSAPANISGSWSGTYKANPDPVYECPSPEAGASATFEQTGATISGTLAATPSQCAFSDVRIQGTMTGNRLDRTMPDWFPGANAVGAVNGDSLTLTLMNTYGYLQGTMHLHR